MRRDLWRMSVLRQMARLLGRELSEEEEIYLDILSQIGGWLMKYRRKENLSQQKLAQKLGLTQRTISEIERGERNLRLSTLAKIAAGLGIRIRIEFVGDEGEKRFGFAQVRASEMHHAPKTTWCVIPFTTSSAEDIGLVEDMKEVA